MQTQILIRSILVLAAAAPLGAHASPLGTRPGAWESTLTTVISGLPKQAMQEVPKEQLDRMTPEQRTQVENMMKLRTGQPVSVTRKTCIKETDTMEKLTADDPANMSCKKKILSQTATSIEVEINCTKPRATTARIRVEAVTPESVVSITDVLGEGGFKMHGESKAHWIGASCEGINPPQPPARSSK